MQVHSLSYDLGDKRWSARFPAGDSPRTLVTLFGAPAIGDHPELFIEVARAYPRSLVVGCSSAGEILGTTVRDDSLAVTVTRFDRTDLQLVSAEIASVADSKQIGAELGEKLAATPGLRAVLVLCDGLAVNGQMLAAGLAGAVGPRVTVTGGLAADGFDFKHTWLTIGGSLKRRAVAAVGFYGQSIVVGHGVSRDWVPQPAEWVITRCEGNFVYELDYQPAIDVYRAALADRSDELPEVAIWYPLAVRTGAEAPVVRAVISIDEQEGAVVLGGEVHHGQSARLLNADLENLIEGGARAASGVARTGAPVSVDCLALAISCFGRRKILGSWSSEELVAMREGLQAQRTAMTGFYAYGQIAPGDDGVPALHNQTLSLTVFSEARDAAATPVRAQRATPPPTVSGYAVRSTLFDARTGAWSQPLPELDSQRTLVLAFGAPELGAGDPRALEALYRQYPSSILLGCSTAGEIHNGTIQDRTMVVSVTRFAKTDLRLAVESLANGHDAAEVGRRIATALAQQPGLQGVLLLSEGVRVNGSELVRGLEEVFAGNVPIAGGLAGDGTAFKSTWVMGGRKLGPDVVAAVGFYGNHVVMGFGSRGGWDRFGMKRTITRSAGNVLYELDGRPALQIYKEYLGPRAAQLPAAGLSLPLAVRDPVTDKQIVRTLVAVDEAAESLTFAGDVPTGHLTQFMKADVERLVNGATHAALMANESGAPAAPECLVVAISCAGRRHMLGAHTEEEVEAIGDTFRSERVRVTGFYAYGELTPGPDGRCELHNQVMSLLVISEALAPVARPARPVPGLAERLGAEPIAPPAVRPPRGTPPSSPRVDTRASQPRMETRPGVGGHSPLPPDTRTGTAPRTTPPPRSTRSAELAAAAVAAATPPSEPGSASALALAPAPALAEPPIAPRGPIVRVPRANVGDVAMEDTGPGDVRIVRIRGRITEAFKGDVAARMLHGRVILDLGDVHRITSFGVREWLAMFAGATALQECYLARCSEAVVNQLTMIRAFDGGAKILSFFAPYLCEGCNKPFERLFDCELDATEIATTMPEPVRCPRCNEQGRFDDDPRSYFAFFGAHGGAVPGDVRAQHAQLCAQDQVRPAEEVEKIVDGDTTRVRITGRLSFNVRWRRLFENIDGALVLDLSAVTAIEATGLQSLDVHLRTLIAAKRHIGIEAAPIALLERLVVRPAQGIDVISVVVAGNCAACGVARTATLRIDQCLADPERGLVAACKRCDRRLDLQPEPALERYLALAAAAAPPVAEAPPGTIPPPFGAPGTIPPPFGAPGTIPPPFGASGSIPPPPALSLSNGFGAPLPAPQPRRRVLGPGVIGGGIGALALVIGIAWRMCRSPAGAPAPADARAVAVAPDAAAGWQSIPDLPPSWADQPFSVDRDTVYLVGESEAPTVDAALAAARNNATVVLIRALADDLAKTKIGALLALRAPKGEVTNAAFAAFDAQYGNLARFERDEVATRPATTGSHLLVRFKLPRATYLRLVAAYKDVHTFRGMDVALVFPTLAGQLGTNASLVVVGITPGSAAAVGKIAVGDGVVKVGATPVASLAAFRTATRDAWVQPDVRQRLTVEVDTAGAARQVFIGVKGNGR